MPAPYYNHFGFGSRFPISIGMFNSCSSAAFCNPDVSTSIDTSAHRVEQYHFNEAYDLSTSMPNYYGHAVLSANPCYSMNAKTLSLTPNKEHSATVFQKTNLKNYVASRRFRTNFTEHQSIFLENSFKESHYPDHRTKRNMAEYLNIPEDRITVWFQNRRAKWRRKENRNRNVNKPNREACLNPISHSSFSSVETEEASFREQKLPPVCELTVNQAHYNSFELESNGTLSNESTN